MAAAALTFREALEVWLVVTAVLSFAGGGARQHRRSLLVAIVGAFLLGAAIGSGAGVFGASLGTKPKAIFQASMMGAGALLMVLAVLAKPPYVRLERRLRELPPASRVRVAPLVLSGLLPIAILTSVLLYDSAVGTWGAADLLGGILGTSMGVFVGLLGAAAILFFDRMPRRAWRALVGLMLFVFLGYVVAYDLDAFPSAGLIETPHVSPDRGVSSIATVLGIASVVLLVRLALGRGEFKPRPFLALINPLFIGVSAYWVNTALQQLVQWHVIAFPEGANWGILAAATVLLGVGFLRSRNVLPDSEWEHPLVSRVARFPSVKRAERRWALVRGRESPVFRGDDSPGG
jgi:hypothetical protein